MTAISMEIDTYCPQHPAVATQMRCNKCGRLLCLKCAVQTPVGYRCKECVYQQQNVYFNAKGHDNLIALGISFGLALVVTPLVALLSDLFYYGAFYLAFFTGPLAGSLLAQLIRLVVARRRGRHLRYFVLAGLVAGATLALTFVSLALGIVFFFDLPLLIFLFLALTTLYQLLR
jgi:hypothetical protein